MIRVDVIVPDVDKSYEFCCDETIKVSDLVKQMIICVEKSEDISDPLFMEEPCLFCKDRMYDLNPEGSLAENGVADGMILLLL